MDRCPTCGQPLRPAPPWEAVDWRDLRFTPPGQVTPAVAPGTTWVRREPARAPTKEDVTVPLAYALVTGAALGAVAGLGALWRGWPWQVPVAVAVLVFALVWLLLMGQWRAMLWRIEEIAGADLDADGQVGKPEPTSQVIRLEVTEAAGRKVSFLDLDLDRDGLARLARLALAGRLTERDLSGFLSRAQWNSLRDDLLARGFLCWRNTEPRQGLELTAGGEALFEAVLRETG